jgi:hypothetical protein
MSGDGEECSNSIFNETLNDCVRRVNKELLEKEKKLQRGASN